MTQHTAHPPKAPHSKPQVAKRASSDVVRRTDTGRPGNINSKNPEKFVVKKEEGGTYEKVDKRTWILRKPKS